MTCALHMSVLKSGIFLFLNSRIYLDALVLDNLNRGIGGKIEVTKKLI